MMTMMTTTVMMVATSAAILVVPPLRALPSLALAPLAASSQAEK
jgi:hypothetical protein